VREGAVMSASGDHGAPRGPTPAVASAGRTQALAGVCVGNTRAGGVGCVAIAQPPGFLVPSAWPWLRPAAEPVACMDAAELARWSAANDVCPPGVRSLTPCADCTPAYAAAMRRADRCHGMPGSDALPGALPARPAEGGRLASVE